MTEDRRREKRFKFRRVNEITGTFVLLVIALLIAAVVWTGHSQRWFKSNVTLRHHSARGRRGRNPAGLGSLFSGHALGSVSDVIVDETGRMEAQANIRHDFFLFVRADSSAVVKKKFGVAGDSFFEITRGQGTPLPEKNASIVCNEQFQSALESAIEEIRRETLLVLKKTNGGLDTWTKLGADLGETRQHLDQLTVRLETWPPGSRQGKGTVGKLLTDTAWQTKHKSPGAGEPDDERVARRGDEPECRREERPDRHGAPAGNYRRRGQRSQRFARPGPANPDLDARTGALD